MKNISTSIFVLLVAVSLGFAFCSFQVRETESVLVTRFGKPIGDPITEPGFYWKWPQPIDQVHRFESRLQVFEGQMEETTTKGGEPVIVTSYMDWRIADPLKFYETVTSATNAQKYLLSQLRNEQNAIIGKHSFNEFINTDPSKIKFAQIEDEIRDSLKKILMDKYGIEVATVGIKKFEISEKVTQQVFNRMRSDRKKKSERILAEGSAEAAKIKADAEAKKTEILATAQARAKAIRGKGDADAAKYYKLLEEDPQLAMFLRDVDALKKILKDRSTIVLGAQTEPIKLLREVPNIEPKQ